MLAFFYMLRTSSPFLFSSLFKNCLQSFLCCPLLWALCPPYCLPWPGEVAICPSPGWLLLQEQLAPVTPPRPRYSRALGPNMSPLCLIRPGKESCPVVGLFSPLLLQKASKSEWERGLITPMLIRLEIHCGISSLFILSSDCNVKKTNIWLARTTEAPI